MDEVPSSANITSDVVMHHAGRVVVVVAHRAVVAGLLRSRVVVVVARRSTATLTGERHAVCAYALGNYMCIGIICIGVH